jgi:hypothetical protein
MRALRSFETSGTTELTKCPPSKHTATVIIRDLYACSPVFIHFVPRCTYQLPSSGSDVKNPWSCTSTSPYNSIAYTVNLFLGALAKFRKATFSLSSFLLPVFLRGANRSQPDGYYEIWYFSIFRNSVEKIKVSLKSDKNNVYFTWRRMYIDDNISLNSPQNKNFFRQRS